MSPTVLVKQGFRFFFFSREESRPHVHVSHERGEAKFWLVPHVALSWRRGLNARDANTAKAILEQNFDTILEAWLRHFGA